MVVLKTVKRYIALIVGLAFIATASVLTAGDGDQPPAKDPPKVDIRNWIEFGVMTPEIDKLGVHGVRTFKAPVAYCHPQRFNGSDYTSTKPVPPPTLEHRDSGPTLFVKGFTEYDYAIDSGETDDTEGGGAYAPEIVTFVKITPQLVEAAKTNGITISKVRMKTELVAKYLPPKKPDRPALTGTLIASTINTGARVQLE